MGHSTKDRIGFKAKVQMLADNKSLIFKEEDPNMDISIT